MLNIWNNAELHLPPINVTKARVSSTDKTEIINILTDAIHVLKNQGNLHAEAASLSRLKYKTCKRFRSDIGFNYLVKTNSALFRYLNCNLENDIQRLLDVMSEEDMDTCLPSKQMLEYLLVKLQGFAKLMCRIVTCCEKTAYKFQQKMNSGHFWQISFLIFSIHSRIWDLCKKLCLQTCNWYDNLVKYLDIFEINGGPWLPAGYILPKQLKVWLGEEWLITDQATYKMKKFRTQNVNRSVFDLIDLSDDEELHFSVEDDADCMIVDENINAEASECNTEIPEVVSSNIPDAKLNVDIGKVISRDNLNSEIMSSNVPGAKLNVDIGKAISRGNLNSEIMSNNVPSAKLNVDIGKAISRENFSSEIATKKNNNANNTNSEDNVQILKNKIKPTTVAEVSSMALKISTTACENKEVKLKKKKKIKEELTIEKSCQSIDTQKKKKKKRDPNIEENDCSLSTITENVTILKNKSKPETPTEISLMALKRPLVESENKEVESQKKKKKKEKSTTVDHSISTIKNANNINSVENVQILKKKNKPVTSTEVSLMALNGPLAESENKEVEPPKKKKKKEKSISTIKNSNNINSVETIQILKKKNKPVTSTEVSLIDLKGPLAESENNEVEPPKKKEKSTIADHSISTIKNSNNINSIENVQILKKKNKPVTSTEVSLIDLKGPLAESENNEVEPPKKKKKKEKSTKVDYSINTIQNSNNTNSVDKGQILKTKPGAVTEVSSLVLKRPATASQNKEVEPQKKKKKKAEPKLDNNGHSIDAIKNGNDLSCFIKTEQMYRQSKDKKSLSKSLGLIQWNSLKNMIETYIITLNSKKTKPSQIENTLKKVKKTWNNRINFQKLLV